jgi:poly-gamma-glutamate synthesis protein (capsule biosynthesis protein)
MVLFLCGDVMPGRGIDQVLPHPCDPILHEDYMKSALGYVQLAERRNGTIGRPVDFPYVWGDALETLDRMGARARIINLETSITAGGSPWPEKGIHYRMHPANAPVLSAARIDAAVLANNHVLDWDFPGLTETLAILDRLGIRRTGAGATLEEARKPAVIEVPGEGRSLIFGMGSESSGIPMEWAATPERPGLLVVEDRSDFLEEMGALVAAWKRPGDCAVASIHWGGNWGYGIPSWQRRLAHGLIDSAGFDLVHGHSSHHAKGIEIHRGRLILYGCGDFITDYEGIGGFEEFRPDLGLMYFPAWDPAQGALTGLKMAAMRMRRFQAVGATVEEAKWLEATLNREGRALGTRVEREADGMLALHWR